MAKRRHAAYHEAAHDTLALRAQMGDPRQWWEYFPGQKVRTPDNILGVVTAVEDGAVQGMEQYQVRLNGGMGGGFYTASQLKPAEATTAAQQHTADLDYPELETILTDRPDPARIHVSAAKGDNPFASKDDDEDDSKDSDDSDDEDDDDSSDDEDDEDDSDDDSPKDDDSKGGNPFAKKDDGDDDGDDQGGGKPFSQVKAMATFSSLITEAIADADFRFHVTAAWRDVVAKAKRIRSEGKVRVTLSEGGVIFGEVHGDHHVYETGLQRLPGRTAVSSWSCGCKWAAYHWGADDDFSRFKGRMCSHALALQYEAQSRGMFGKDITVDEHKPAWVPRDVVVRWDIDSATNQMVRSSVKVAGYDPYGEWDGEDDDEDSQEHARQWDRIHEGLGDIHRGVNVHLRPEDHAIVHDESRPLHERALHLMKSLPHSDLARGNPGLGRHWTDNEGVAESFGDMDSRTNRHGVPPTSVVFHAEKPDRDAIDENPDQSDGMIYGYHDHGEREIPLHPGAGVNLKGVSWKNMHTPDDDFRTVHGDGLFDHLFEHQRHDFPGGHSAYAALASAPLQSLASALVRAGEDAEEMQLTLAVVGVRVTADTNAPFGEPTSGEAYQTPHAPGATQPRRKGENPASAGFLTGGDPSGWDLALPGTLDDRLGSRAWSVEASLFEPGVTAVLDDMPQGALPATEGEVSNDDGATAIPAENGALDSDLTASLRKRALAEFSPAEQRELIDEGEKEGARARNLDDRLAIEGTHYAELEKQLQQDGSDDGGLLW